MYSLGLALHASFFQIGYISRSVRPAPQSKPVRSGKKSPTDLMARLQVDSAGDVAGRLHDAEIEIDWNLTRRKDAEKIRQCRGDGRSGNLIQVFGLLRRLRTNDQFAFRGPWQDETYGAKCPGDPGGIAIYIASVAGNGHDDCIGALDSCVQHNRQIFHLSYCLRPHKIDIAVVHAGLGCCGVSIDPRHLCPGYKSDGNRRYELGFARILRNKVYFSVENVEPTCK